LLSFFPTVIGAQQTAVINEEVKGEAGRLFERALTRCGQDYYAGWIDNSRCANASLGRPVQTCRHFVEYRGVEYEVLQDDLSTADHLNGLEWSGTLVVKFAAARRREVNYDDWGAWGEWYTGQPLVIRFSKDRGKWSSEIDNSHRPPVVGLLSVTPASNYIESPLPCKYLSSETAHGEDKVAIGNRTEGIKLSPNSPSAERDATIVAPGVGLHNYNVVLIDTSEFKKGGVLKINIRIAPDSSTDGSFDLFQAFTPTPTKGPPTGTLVGRYDVPKGTETQIEFGFGLGQVFKFGLEGNWSNARQGVAGSVHFTASVSKHR
jgi:hypothetical protein